MSSDHETPPSPEAARAFGRWLDRPGDAPPDDLDEDVLHAVYAIRPDLAPAPRLSLDDILDGVTTGPFAADQPTTTADPASQEGADVVPFPTAAEATPAETAAPSSRPGTAARWAGGMGGAGIALVVAATLLLSLYPQPSAELAEPAAPAAAVREAPTKSELSEQVAEAPPADAPVLEAATPHQPSRGRRAEKPLAAAPTASPPAADAKEAAASGPALAAEDALNGAEEEPEAEVYPRYDIAQRTALSERSVIPEVEAREATEDLDGVMDEELRDVVAEDDEAADPAPPPPAWRVGAPPAVLSSADALLARAEALASAGDPAAGGTLLLASLTAPAPVAHQLALRAAELFLQADDPTSARKALDRASSFGVPTADQSARRARLVRQAAE